LDGCFFPESLHKRRANVDVDGRSFEPAKDSVFRELAFNIIVLPLEPPGDYSTVNNIA
jgi:hypothetical protein